MDTHIFSSCIFFSIYRSIAQLGKKALNNLISKCNQISMSVCEIFIASHIIGWWGKNMFVRICDETISIWILIRCSINKHSTCILVFLLFIAALFENMSLCGDKMWCQPVTLSNNEDLVQRRPKPFLIIHMCCSSEFFLLYILIAAFLSRAYKYLILIFFTGNEFHCR